MSTVSNGSSGAGPLSRREYALVLVELTILAVVAWTYQLDPYHRLPAAMILAAVGFAIHDRLPARLQLPCFLALSAIAFSMSLGVPNAALLAAIGGTLVVTAASPLAWWQRCTLLAGATAVIVGLRIHIASPIWIVLGSMFMFRLPSYLHCVRREGTKASRLMIWAYFFVPPNAFYGLFPVIDYTTFCETYFDSDRRRIYQSGIHYLTLGLLQLILYRMIKYEILPAPLEVRTVRSLALFLAANYGLYVYVSGTFHVICGILHLFGFHLPRTHDNYFLAASFTDIWRRINTYWKDFLQKLVFLPAVYRLRSGGLVRAVIAGVLWTFFWTWLAHAWQQFWLLGEFPLRFQEACLWMSAGTLVAVNAVFEMRSSTRSATQSPGFRWQTSLARWLKVIGVFAMVSLFWASWTHPEIMQLLSASVRDQLSGQGARTWITASPIDAAVLGAVAVAIVLIGIAGDFLKSSSQLRTVMAKTFNAPGRTAFESSVMSHLVPLAVVVLLAQTPVHSLLGTRVSSVLPGLKSEHVTSGEAIGAIRGYYEQLSAGSILASPLGPNPGQNRNESVAVFSTMTRPRRDVLVEELIPGWQGSYGGGHITVNRWGMRDRDRELVKAPGGFRIAMVGSSVVMGAGVDDAEVSSRIIERRLNGEPSAWGTSVEVLNFGMGLYSPVQRRALIQHKVLPFTPDLVIYVAHQDERDGSTTSMANAISHSIELEDPGLDELVRSMRIPRDSSEIMYFAKAGEMRDEILACTYQAIRDACQAARAAVLYVYLPIPGDHQIAHDPRMVIGIARQAGLETVDLTGWWKDYRPAEVLVSEADHHPNRLGQQLLAEALERVLRQAKQRQAATSAPNP